MTSPIVLITGGNRGIGFETAKQLAERGFYVVVSARDESQGQQAAEKLKTCGEERHFFHST
jgi:NAD(P)-dependent dehydrogenase (short-subunit alcohol dehydrogenase family)